MTQKEKIIAFLNENPLRTNKEIAEGVGITESNIRSVLYKMKKSKMIKKDNGLWITDDNFQKKQKRKVEIADYIIEDCFIEYQNTQSLKDKIKLANIIIELLKKY